MFARIHREMRGWQKTLWFGLAIVSLAASCETPAYTRIPAILQQSASQDQEKAVPPEASSAPLPRGKKLVLKDGTFHMVRSFERKGNRVRFYSIERSSWEEMPADMIDWEATKKAEAETAKGQEALLEKVRSREAIEKYQPVDIDASLPIAPGVFLPPGEGLFALEGTMVRPLEQVSAETKLDKKRQLEKIFVPIPIVPTRHRVQIRGARAAVRIATALPEFYLREAPPDPDRPSVIPKSSRPGESGPEVELIRATVRSGTRQIEVLDTNLIGQQSAQRNTISLQRWEVAKGVYRFTLSEQLTPGEYAIAELLPEGLNLYVWDFGVDLGSGAEPKGKPAANKKPQKAAGSKP
ncbi:MAG TPA: hypothetical protein VOA41_05255 [Candidatus Dormibacteraeota bacterium]|nr:hypothetical protein [Candidatus Dormibacteraeota bacterium]